ncbi:MAG: alanine racemase [Thioalkalispiraceae bacterium]|jgi:alanine racemase
MSCGLSRATRATINLSNLRHNLSIARQHVANAHCMAIIKANGYGHGIVQVAHALSEQAEAFGVTSLEEAISLREAGIAQRIIVLSGFIRAEDLNLIRGYNLEVVVYHACQLGILETDRGAPLQCWLKIDTGMHRLGFSITQARGAYQRLLGCSTVAKPLHMMTHLANADDRDDKLTEQQCQQFKSLLDELGFDDEQSIANSAGILGWNQLCPGSHGQWIRPGIMLYGVSPFIDSIGEDHGLKPVMTLSSELIAVNNYSKGDAIGYGGTYRCEQDMPVGVVAIGYGDGYPRHIASDTPVLINGKHVPIVGRVSMDMLTVDLRDCPEAGIGDEVILWGEGLPVEMIADKAGTIGYELLCGVTSRVQYIYQN